MGNISSNDTNTKPNTIKKKVEIVPTQNFNKKINTINRNNTMIPNMYHLNENNLNHQSSQRMAERQFNVPNIPYNPDNLKQFTNTNHYTPYNIQQPAQQSYIPRMEQPELQRKIDKNTMENQYQNLYQQRNMETGFKPVEQENIINNNMVDEHSNNTIDNNLELSLKIFQLHSNYTENQLKDSYKNLVLKYHPDRGGEPQKFQYINKCYTYLLQQLELKIKDAQYQQLKEQSNQYMEKQNTYQNINIDQDNFDLTRFNNVFNDNKLDKTDDIGYSNWMKENSFQSEDIVKNSNINDKNFNDVFNQNRQPEKQELVKYRDPIPTPINTNLAYSEIDDSGKDDYSSSSNNSILYTDYKKAHTKTHLIDPNSIQRKEYKNVDDLETDRSNISYQMTEKELQEEKIHQNLLKQQEQERVSRVQQKDQLHSEHFHKVNRIMLGN